MEEILERLERIERNTLLASKNVLSLDDVAQLTNMSKSHIYKLTSGKTIPHYRPFGKMLFFDKKEIEDWMRQNRVNTTAEAEQAAIAYVMRNKK